MKSVGLMMQHVCGFANMLTFLGFLICMFERYSYYFILFDLLLIFSRFISLTLQKLWKDDKPLHDDGFAT